jgi:hypothetical protein
MQSAQARRARPPERDRRTRRSADPSLGLSERGADPRSQSSRNGPYERRTIVITGRPGPAPVRRSPTARRLAARPDRVALWAFMLAVFLVVVAAATAHAAPL